MRCSTSREVLSLVAVVAALAAGWRSAEGGAPRADAGAARGKIAPFHADVASLARRNEDFRHVLFTGAKTQLVMMSLPPGTDVGVETHARVEQTFFFVSGTGRATLDGQSVDITPGDVLVVPPGTTHDVVATGEEPLRLYTVYVPPNHLDGRVQRTKQDAERDHDDEAFGRRVE
jgi:mannose-6-phosphate isomerase-like protein (cupin superfamily)